MFLAKFAKSSIIALVISMALGQFQVAEDIVSTAFAGRESARGEVQVIQRRAQISPHRMLVSRARRTKVQA